MRTGRLAISRGFSAPEPHGEPARFALISTEGAAAPPQPAPEAEPASSDALAMVNARLAALERLTRLCEAGALSIDEFLIEKAAILGHPPSALSGPRAPDAPPISFQPAAPRARPKGHSLAGRLGWAIVPLGLLAGLALSGLSQPDVMMRLYDEALRMIGA